jgi:4-amino-4-deoxy-L-arabinose transferase-like glycosyltransferase
MKDGFQSGRRTWIFLFVCYALGLWGLSVPLTGDQKTYLTIALEMRERGELIIPTLFGEPNFLKPPLQYWATLIGWAIFGFGLWGALLPSVLALIGASDVVGRLSARNDALAGTLFAGTLASMTYGTTAQMEIWVVLFYCWAWHLWWQGRVFPAFVVTGVMSWIKGPLYPVLWVLSITLEAALGGGLRPFLGKRRFWIALSTGVMIGLSWYLLAARTHYREMMDMFFLRENLGKVSTSHGTPWGLWGEFIGTLFPILIAFATVLPTPEFREAWKRNRSRWVAYSTVPALFFTLFPYRVNTYLYLLTPVVVWMLVEAGEGFKRHARVAGWIALIAGGGLLLFVLRMVTGGWIGFALGGGFAALIPCWVLAHFRGSLRGVALTSVAMVSLIRVAAVGIGEGDLAGLRNALELWPDSAFAYVMPQKDIWHEVGMMSAATGKRLQVLKTRADAEQHLRSGGVLILDGLDLPNDPTLRCLDWVRLRKRVKFPIREFLLRGLPVSDPSLHRVLKLCRS